MRRVIFYVPPKVHILDLTGPAHVFFELSTFGIDYELVYCSSYQSVTSTANMVINNFTKIDDIIPSPDDIVMIAGAEFDSLTSRSFIAESKAFIKWLKLANEKKAIICSVCTGIFILAESGLLNNKSCTTHWKYIHILKKTYPLLNVKKDILFVEDDRIYSSAGVSTGIDLALYLIEKIHGIFVASEVSKEMLVYLRRDGLNSQKSIFIKHRNHLQSDIHKIQDYIISNLDKKLLLNDLAAMIFESERNFTRIFKKTMGCTVSEYITELRKEKAISLIKNTNLNKKSIAKECGFKSENQLRNILK